MFEKYSNSVLLDLLYSYQTREARNVHKLPIALFQVREPSKPFLESW